ncbi:cytochrome c oxidase subunit II [Arvimicrobium flavum]|uniref:cytochrome c oxidase subunit II n=1 Tax=Arvimicrobium flavum TaxID=3393320 RepID=UPI00237BCA72|nr:cytochrome c oxidase subunit II [Mesorhizobium shangrilense]
MERAISRNELPERVEGRPAASSRAGPCRAGALLAGSPLLASCSGVQSALDPAGDEASQVATLFWTMTIGGAVIWACVVALSLYAARWNRSPISEEAAGRLILWAGVVFPVSVLTALLAYAFWLMPSLRPFAGHEQTGLRVEVAGSQFWWHVVYHRPDGSRIVSANEVRLPVGQRVEFSLESRDMIHSFWIPALGGKMDLIPGRTNRLSLLGTKAGVYRGQCAEFCGTSHALMAFAAIVMEPPEFEAWLDARSTPSPGIGGRGQDIFLREGCGDCHRVDGTPAQGASGPDLSHVGSRLTIGAALMKNDPEALARFVAHPGSLKPLSQMPSYLDLSAEELAEIAAWLKGLQ